MRSSLESIGEENRDFFDNAKGIDRLSDELDNCLVTLSAKDLNSSSQSSSQLCSFIANELNKWTVALEFNTDEARSDSSLLLTLGAGPMRGSLGQDFSRSHPSEMLTETWRQCLQSGGSRSKRVETFLKLA
ncbi:hypothetical protein FOZ60_011575 [Perkinsus olseni]|uniref:Uncharacterized protein n=1 Tax=Perkinsus olseni TaxID=32597 RepID=A0A7J6ND73_PEROL|nr:hypothetical protein FOZ60_011575 [Perkinsus olseni]